MLRVPALDGLGAGIVANRLDRLHAQALPHAQRLAEKRFALDARDSTAKAVIVKFLAQIELDVARLGTGSNHGIHRRAHHHVRRKHGGKAAAQPLVRGDVDKADRR